jgi:hypothetical protein
MLPEVVGLAWCWWHWGRSRRERNISAFRKVVVWHVQGSDGRTREGYKFWSWSMTFTGFGWGQHTLKRRWEGVRFTQKDVCFFLSWLKASSLETVRCCQLVIKWQQNLWNSRHNVSYDVHRNRRNYGARLSTTAIPQAVTSLTRIYGTPGSNTDQKASFPDSVFCDFSPDTSSNTGTAAYHKLDFQVLLHTLFPKETSKHQASSSTIRNYFLHASNTGLEGRSAHSDLAGDLTSEESWFHSW